MYTCVSAPITSTLLSQGQKARRTVFHEEILDEVGISDGLRFLVQMHHVGTEDVDVLLALAEQSLCASFLGDIHQRQGVSVQENTQFSPRETCSLRQSCRGTVGAGLSFPKSSFHSHSQLAPTLGIRKS